MVLYSYILMVGAANLTYVLLCNREKGNKKKKEFSKYFSYICDILYMILISLKTPLLV